MRISNNLNFEDALVDLVTLSNGQVRIYLTFNGGMQKERIYVFKEERELLKEER